MSGSLHSVPPAEAALDISAVVLAGGRGSRMGGVDKGLQSFRGQSLVQNALLRLMSQKAPVPQHLMVSANRHVANYTQTGAQVVSDTLADYQGPLAGILAAAQVCQTPYLLVVPCDSPNFPLDLSARLWAAMQLTGARLAIAWAPMAPGGLMRSQPVFCLMQSSLGHSLQRYLQDGGRRIGTWVAAEGAAAARFDLPGDDPRAFANANTLEELRLLEG